VHKASPNRRHIYILVTTAHPENFMKIPTRAPGRHRANPTGCTIKIL